MLLAESAPVRRHWFEPTDAREDQGARFVEGESIKQICRELRWSRNTVRKVIRSGATEFTHDRRTQPRPKIDPSRSELDELLAGWMARCRALAASD